MPRTDGQLDLASMIEAKASAWTVEALADLLAVSPKTLYKMANSGRIPVIRIAGMLRFDRVLTANWLRARMTGTALRKVA
jgi:excisionase family DNA binding protein